MPHARWAVAASMYLQAACSAALPRRESRRSPPALPARPAHVCPQVLSFDGGCRSLEPPDEASRRFCSDCVHLFRRVAALFVCWVFLGLWRTEKAPPCRLLLRRPCAGASTPSLLTPLAHPRCTLHLHGRCRPVVPQTRPLPTLPRPPAHAPSGPRPPHAAACCTRQHCSSCAPTGCWRTCLSMTRPSCRHGCVHAFAAGRCCDCLPGAATVRPAAGQRVCHARGPGFRV